MSQVVRDRQCVTSCGQHCLKIIFAGMVQRRTKSDERALIGLRPIGKAGEFWPFSAAHDQCIHLRLQGVAHMVQQWLALHHVNSLVATAAARWYDSNHCAERLPDGYLSPTRAIGATPN